MLCWCVGGGGPVRAELDGGAGYSLAHDTNITRVENDPVAGWTQTLFAGFGYQERTMDVNARLVAQMEKRRFLRSTFGDDTTYFLDGAAVWTISPQQFTWTLEDVLREVRSDITAPDTPTNRVQQNSLSTGPDLVLRVSPAHTPVMGARYGRFTIEGPGDNERVTAYARWLYRAWRPGSLSLNYEVMRLNFEPPTLITEAVREDWIVRYFTPPALDATTIDLGTTRVRPKEGDELNGRLARLSTARRLTSESALRVLLADEISDTYTDLLAALAGPASDLGGVGGPTAPTAGGVLGPLQGGGTATGDVYRSRRSDLTYANQGTPLAYTLQGFSRRIDYDQLNQDYREKGGILTLAWLYSGDTRFYAESNHLRRTFQTLERRDVERTNRVGVTLRLTREVSLAAEVQWAEAEVQQPPSASTAATGNFVNRTTMLVLAYSTGPLYAPRFRR